MFKTNQELESNLNRINKKENIALKKRKAIEIILYLKIK